MKIRIPLFITLSLLPKASTDTIPCIPLSDSGLKDGVASFGNVNISGTERARSCP